LNRIEQCFKSPPTQYRLYGSRFLQVKRPNQQYQSTEGTNSTQRNQTYNNYNQQKIKTIQPRKKTTKADEKLSQAAMLSYEYDIENVHIKY